MTTARPPVRSARPARRAGDPAPCYHGGASIEAVGDRFASLDRAGETISADVLDAWYPPAPGALEEVGAHLSFLMRRSPPADCGGLLRAIAEARDVPADSLVPGAGSSDLIFRAFLAWLTPRSRVLLLDPTYGEYAHVLERVIHCRVDRLVLHRERDYAVDPDELRERLRARYDLVVIVNPNSPTGRHIPPAVLRSVLDSAPARTRVWIDEAYVDYCGPAASLEGYAATRRNTVVCKSMSKVYALSGARVAYLCAPPALAASIRAITPPWVVSLPAQLAAMRALADPAYYAARYAETHVLRRELAASLRALDGIDDVLESGANFLLCHLSPRAMTVRNFAESCRSHGLYVRDLNGMTARPLPHAVRIAVKDRDTNHRMAAVVRAVLGA